MSVLTLLSKNPEVTQVEWLCERKGLFKMPSAYVQEMVRWSETKWKHSEFRSDSESVDSNEEWMLFSNTTFKHLFHIRYFMEMLWLESRTAESEF